MEVDTRMMMRTLLLPARKRKKGNSRRFPVESLPLKMDNKKKDMRKSSALHVTSLGIMQVNV
jgi:hypothetical protein